METFADRFTKALENKGFTAYKLSQLTGVSQSTVSYYKSGRNIPRPIVIHQLASVLEVNPTWLETGEGEMDIKADAIKVTDAFELEYVENNNSNTFMKLENGQYLMTMPLAEFNVQAGLLDHYQDIEYIKEMAKHSVIVDEPYKGRYMAFRVKGDSMDDGTSNAITPNSIVATRELQRQHWTSKLRFKDFKYWIIYTTESKMPLLKEITDHNPSTGVITCHSLNDSPEYIDFQLSLNDVQALFYVVNVTKEMSNKSYY